MGSQSTESFQKFLDSQQYTKKGILLYEEIFGPTFVSTGGLDTTIKFCNGLDLRPHQKVLDIGCGTGGSAFVMARRYGVDVHGVDLSRNMIAIAEENRLKAEPAVSHRVHFEVADATTMAYPDNFYDVIYSRDTILHIVDKAALFRTFFRCLKPGGLVMITDYCRGDQKHPDDFEAYVAQRGYALTTVAEYGRALESAGFKDVETVDNSQYFIEVLKTELQRFEPKKEFVSRNYTADDYNYILNGWKTKVQRVSAGDQAWGYWKGRKYFA